MPIMLVKSALDGVLREQLDALMEDGLHTEGYLCEAVRHPTGEGRDVFTFGAEFGRAAPLPAGWELK